jgi:filamentous hemagglutinin family protein
VSGGDAVIRQDGAHTQIQQQSHRAIIDWQAFDLSAEESVTFAQPSAAAIILNRIHDVKPSFIDGAISSNGQVWMINPHGMLFGRNAVVDVGGLLASASDIPNQDFLAGHDHFSIPAEPDAFIANEGILTAKEAGLVGLVAPRVENSGIIAARLGKVHLASGDTFGVDLYGDGLISLEASADLQQQIAANSGIIAAEGGRVLLTAAAAKDVVDSLIVNSGVISATSAGGQQGSIRIHAEGVNAVTDNDAGKKGTRTGASTVLNSGVLDVSGRDAGERGGSITVTGDQVALLAGSILDASGDSGLSGTTAGKAASAYRDGAAGGDIRIGGDYLGLGDTPTAQNLYVDSGALILNDAITQGDAGRTIFWADHSNLFAGAIYARGGYVNGNGGFAEVSGKEYLDFDGSANLTAQHGKKGTLLLDPTNITIYNGASTTDSGLILNLMMLEGSGTNVNDYSSSNLDGTLIGGTAWSSLLPSNSAYTGNYSLSFDGLNDKVGIGSLGNLGYTTVAMDFRFSAASNHSWPITFDTAFRQGIIIDDHLFRYRAYGVDVSVNYNFTIGQFYHLAVVARSGGIDFYVDGALIGTRGISTATHNFNDVRLGATQDNVEWFRGNLQDVRIYNRSLNSTEIGLLADNSAISIQDLQRISQTADIYLLASNNINLNFQGDTLNFTTAGRSLTLDAGNQITTASAGNITTNNGNISLTGTNGILLNHAMGFTSNNGNISFNNPITLGADTTINAGTGAVSFGGTVNGGYDLTASAGSFSFGGAMGGSTRLGDVSLTSAGAMSLGAIRANTLLARTTGATADLTLTGAFDVDGAGTPLTLASGRHFINSGGSLSVPSGRWLIYSADPAQNTLGGLSAAFKRYNCTYGGACPSLGTGNGFLYSLAPTISVTADNKTREYGLANPAFTASYSGFVDGDTSAVLSGALSLTSAATSASNVGSYTITSALGTLANSLGYQFSYTNGSLSVTPATLTVTADNKTREYGLANPAFTASYSGFRNGDTASVLSGAAALTTTATSASNVGSYTINAGAGTLGSTNYNFSFTNGSLSVTPATLTVTANNASREYGLANPAFTASYSGFRNADTASVLSGAASLTTAATPFSSPGNYAISTGRGTLSSTNYLFDNVNGILAVTASADLLPTGSLTFPFQSCHSSWASDNCFFSDPRLVTDRYFQDNHAILAFPNDWERNGEPDQEDRARRTYAVRIALP